MLRVLTLSTLFPDSSRPRFGSFVERQIMALAARDDTDIRVVAPIGIPPWPLDKLGHHRQFHAVPRQENYNGVSVYRPRFVTVPGTDGRFNAVTLTLRLMPLLSQIREDFPFDLISAEFFHPDGAAAIELGRHFSVPVSIKARGSDIHFWGEKPAVRRQMVKASQKATAMLAVSDALRTDMIALGMDGSRIQQITTGVDLDRFAPIDRTYARQQLGLDSGPLIVSTGALIPIKGHEIVIRALAELPNATLCIAGEGPDRGKLASLIQSLGMADRVQLLGNIPHAELALYLAAADMMALASEREGLANAWMEALASGTPVVVPDVGGARQIVRSPLAGRIVARTPTGFARGMREILEQQPEPADVRTLVTPFSWTANSDRHFAYYSDMIRAYRKQAGASELLSV